MGEGFGGLLEFLDIDSPDLSLSGYFLECKSLNRRVLYIPDCLAVVEASGEEDNYFNCDRPEVLMDRGRFGIGGKLYFEGVGYSVKQKIMLPQRIEEFFRNVTFDQHYSSLAAQFFLKVWGRFNNSEKRV
jgi:hypothetical protein